MEIKIEKNVPITEKQFGVRKLNPLVPILVSMQVNDSFILPSEFTPKKIQFTITQTQKLYAMKFSWRKIGESYRLWRIK